MKTYELTYIISSEISSEEAGVKAKEFCSFVESKEGTMLRSENPVAKTLSYPIKKFGSGYFVVLEFKIEPEKLSDLREKLEKDDEILRHVIIIKHPARIRKERRGARKPINIVTTTEATEKLDEKKPDRKIELEDIEKKLDEILG